MGKLKSAEQKQKQERTQEVSQKADAAQENNQKKESAAKASATKAKEKEKSAKDNAQAKAEKHLTRVLRGNKMLWAVQRRMLTTRPRQRRQYTRKQQSKLLRLVTRPKPKRMQSKQR